MLSLKRIPLNKCLMIDLVFGRKGKKTKPGKEELPPFGVCRLLISHLVVQTSRPAPRPLLQIRNHTNTLPKVTFTGKQWYFIFNISHEFEFEGKQVFLFDQSTSGRRCKHIQPTTTNTQSENLIQKISSRLIK